MRETIELGSTPYEEDCFQVGEDSQEDIRAECQHYVNYLRVLFPIPDNLKNTTFFRVKSYQHDFGVYYEAVISFDTNDEKAWTFALSVENNLPAHWDTKQHRERNADHVDGYDRDDTGESPDY